jgi:hypothetical protein
MIKFYLTVFFLSMPALSLGQTVTASSKGKLPPEGIVHAHDSLGNYPKSIADLVTRSQLIIDCLIDASLPSRLSDAKNPLSIQTDVVVLVKQVYKGSLNQASFPHVAIEQLGGSMGKLQVVHDQDSPLQPGSRHILFLEPDSRVGLPNVAGLPRYLVVGIWVGKFRVENHKISASKNSHDGIKMHELEDEDSFISGVMQEIALQESQGKP